MSAGAPAPVTALPRIVFVTGTDTGVGKTVVTAALAAALSARSRSVAVYKPTQAGLEDGAGDIDLVRALAGIDDVHEGIRLRHADGARRGGRARGRRAARRRRPSGHDPAARLRPRSHASWKGPAGCSCSWTPRAERWPTSPPRPAGAAGSAAVIVVCRAALGTLNHTELTIEALTRRRVPVAGLVVGAWPREPTDDRPQQPPLPKPPLRTAARRHPRARRPARARRVPGRGSRLVRGSGLTQVRRPFWDRARRDSNSRPSVP